jgi:hypothetical protein
VTRIIDGTTAQPMIEAHSTRNMLVCLGLTT